MRTLLPSLFGLSALIYSTLCLRAATDSALTLPVKEVTVFKDGHAFVVHEGRLPVDAAGQAVMDYLPAPVIGTFWAYSSDKQTKLVSVTASQRRTRIERTALQLRELLEANVGQEVFISETNNSRYEATIVGFPTRSYEELAATSPPNSDPRLPEKGPLVLLKTTDGTRAVAVDRIVDVTFKSPPKTATASEEFRNGLTLKLDRNGRSPGPSADVGLVYLQKGIRWIPSYKVDLDGKGQARISLQATVVNEMVDLDNVTLQLVIGVPSFYFKDTIDPIALQQTAAQLSSYFQGQPARGSRASLLGQNFSNGMMTQVARMGDYRGDVEQPAGGAGDVPESAKREDLFVFTVPKVTLRKGERIVLPLVEVTVPYEDVFTLDLPFAPPAELYRNFNNDQQGELARLLAAPKVMHKVRLANKSTYPFTTAPALMLREGRVLSQGMMTYASPGASADLTLTAAVDIQVKKTDSETKRTPNAFELSGNRYLRVDLQGRVRLTNHRAQPVEIEITRYTLGQVDSADHEGRIEMSNVFESRDFLPAGDYSGDYSWWWSWGGWPWWWHHVNTVGRITWKVKLAPGASDEVGYGWHYCWL